MLTIKLDITSAVIPHCDTSYAQCMKGKLQDACEDCLNIPSFCARMNQSDLTFYVSDETSYTTERL
jgi:hypothetical protein